MSLDLITVPDISADELTAELRRKFRVNFIFDPLPPWDFYLGLDDMPILSRGQQFEPVLWQPNLGPFESVSLDVARTHFAELGVIGHVGAFFSWLLQTKNRPRLSAMPLEDHACYRHGRAPHLYTPHAVRQEVNFDCPSYGIPGWPLTYGWSRGWTLVGFREMS